MLSKGLLCTYLALLLGVNLQAQILDDSTELVYGPGTVALIFEKDLLLNTGETTAIDTTLDNLERFDYLIGENNFHQHLGNIGTAQYPVFPELPSVIGRTSGYGAFDRYNIDPSRKRYYDTKSPFMDLKVVLGGQGRTVINYTFTQNVNPNLNIGLDIQKFNIDKQIGAERNEGDRNVDHTQFDLFTFYAHPAGRYKLMAYGSLFSHKVDETGGIFVAEDAPEAARFQYRDANIWLEDARNVEDRFDLHLYHEFALFRNFQVYHRLDRNTQENTYRDFAEGSRGGGTYDTFYPRFLIDPDSTYQQSNFDSFTNEGGLKGSLAAVYYRFYYKNRLVDHTSLFLDNLDRTFEHYIGGVTKFAWKDVFDVTGELELMQSGEFKLGGYLTSDLLNVSYRTVRYRQSSLSQNYFGNHHEWQNSFEEGFATELKGDIELKWKGITFQPTTVFQTLDNFVYFDTLGDVRQETRPALVTRVGGRVAYFLPLGRSAGSGIYFQNEGYYTNLTGASASSLRVPPLFYSGEVYWSGNWFNQTVPARFGVSLRSRSAFFGYAYDPSILQFHLQDREELPAYLAADMFLNMRVEKIWLFAKLTYANMAPEDGYFVSPLYPGQPRVFDFGVRWLFFD